MAYLIRPSLVKILRQLIRCYLSTINKTGHYCLFLKWKYSKYQHC